MNPTFKLTERKFNTPYYAERHEFRGGSAAKHLRKFLCESEVKGTLGIALLNPHSYATAQIEGVDFIVFSNPAEMTISVIQGFELLEDTDELNFQNS
jgi:hypothetical protein